MNEHMKEHHLYIDGKRYEADKPSLTGAQLKEIANIPPAYQLYMEEEGDRPDKKIADDESVELKHGEHTRHFFAEPSTYRLIVNKVEKEWPDRYITGAQILGLAGSPPDWVVNELVPGAGEDPEIGPTQSVDLSFKAEPKGIKRFQTRKPKTNPGS